MREVTSADPWSMSPWGGNPNTGMGNIPGVEVPKAPQGPRAPRQKRAVPNIDELFDIQKDLVKAVNALKHLEDDPTDHGEFKKAQRNVENAYRILVRYLNKYGGAGGQAGLGF